MNRPDRLTLVLSRSNLRPGPQNLVFSRSNARPFSAELSNNRIHVFRRFMLVAGCIYYLCHVIPQRLDAGDKPSTWFPPGRLEEHLHLKVMLSL